MVMVRQADRPYTAEDLARIPDDGWRYEVLGGELIVSPSPSEKHQRASMKLALQIQSFVQHRDLGATYAAPLDVHLSEHDILQPDLVVMLKGNRSRIRKHGIVGPPDLLIEIISPGSRGTDRVRKWAAYAVFGVPEYWIVEPDTETILAQELRGGRYHPIESKDGLTRSKVLDGLVVDPQEIFAVPEWLSEIAE